MSEHDGLDEVFEQTLRVTMTSGARVGETLARVRQHFIQQAQRESEASAAALSRRLEAERQLGRGAYDQALTQPLWWERATPHDIAEAYRMSTAWREVDPAADQAARHIETEVQRRYGVDLASYQPGEIGPVLDHAEQALKAQTEHREREALENLAAAEAADQAARHQQEQERAEELREAAQLREDARDVEESRDETGEKLGTGVDEVREHGRDHESAALNDAAARLETEPAYDSRERRQAEAEAMAAKGVPAEVVQARMLADVGSSKPAEEIAQATSRPKARRTRGQSAGVSREADKSRGR